MSCSSSIRAAFKHSNQSADLLESHMQSYSSHCLLTKTVGVSFAVVGERDVETYGMDTDSCTDLPLTVRNP